MQCHNTIQSGTAGPHNARHFHSGYCTMNQTRRRPGPYFHLRSLPTRQKKKHQTAMHYHDVHVCKRHTLITSTIINTCSAPTFSIPHANPMLTKPSATRHAHQNATTSRVQRRPQQRTTAILRCPSIPDLPYINTVLVPHLSPKPHTGMDALTVAGPPETCRAPARSSSPSTS